MPKQAPPFYLESLNNNQWKQHVSIPKTPNNFWVTRDTPGPPVCCLSLALVCSFVFPRGTTVWQVCVSHPWLAFCVNMYSKCMSLFVWLTVHLSARGDLGEGVANQSNHEKGAIVSECIIGTSFMVVYALNKCVCDARMSEYNVRKRKKRAGRDELASSFKESV